LNISCNLLTCTRGLALDWQGIYHTLSFLFFYLCFSFPFSYSVQVFGDDMNHCTLHYCPGAHTGRFFNELRKHNVTTADLPLIYCTNISNKNLLISAAEYYIGIAILLHGLYTAQEYPHCILCGVCNSALNLRMCNIDNIDQSCDLLALFCNAFFCFENLFM